MGKLELVKKLFVFNEDYDVCGEAKSCIGVFTWSSWWYLDLDGGADLAKNIGDGPRPGQTVAGTVSEPDKKNIWRIQIINVGQQL